MSFFTVDLLTPSKVLVKSLPADSIEVNTEMGIIGVLPHHMNLLASLAPGMLTIFEGEKKTHFFVTIGACKVLGNKITVISSVAEKAEEIDSERAKRAFEKSKEKLKDILLPAGEIVKYTRKMQRAEERLKVALFLKK